MQLKIDSDFSVCIPKTFISFYQLETNHESFRESWLGSFKAHMGSPHPLFDKYPCLSMDHSSWSCFACFLIREGGLLSSPGFEDPFCSPSHHKYMIVLTMSNRLLSKTPLRSLTVSCVQTLHLSQQISTPSRYLQRSTLALQLLLNQLKSLFLVVLQIQRALYFLTTVKGDTYIFFHKECCHYLKQSA